MKNNEMGKIKLIIFNMWFNRKIGQLILLRFENKEEYKKELEKFKVELRKKLDNET